MHRASLLHFTRLIDCEGEICSSILEVEILGVGMFARDSFYTRVVVSRVGGIGGGKEG